MEPAEGTASSSPPRCGPSPARPSTCSAEVEQPQPDDPEPDKTLDLWPGQSCTFYARADDPHPSGNDASGHGAWVNTSNPASNCPSRALVTVRLQAWECDVTYPYRCAWYTKETRTQTKYSDQQVAVHFPCRTSNRSSWRTRVTVRVPISGWLDKSDKDTNEKIIRCQT